MAWQGMRECRSETQGGGGGTAANPQGELADPGQPVVAPG
jgi:hypothetical protein